MYIRMLNKNDITLLREMFSSMLEKNNIVLRNEMRGMIFASEESIVRQVRDEMHSLVRASEHRVISQVTNFIALSIVPQIDDHDTRITRLEQKTV